MLDCVVVGGGPSGLNASLVLARAKRNIILFDEDKPRNAITHESHGFLTRDGIKPSEFKKVAKDQIRKYPNLSIQNQRVTNIQKENQFFQIHTGDGKAYRSKKVILSTGLKDVMPQIEGLHDFYGTSLFICPFCDGWELKDRPIVIISEDERTFHLTKMVFNWSKDLVVCTNGKKILTSEQRESFEKNDIQVIEDEISVLQGDKGQLASIQFTNGKEIRRDGGFISSKLEQASPLAQLLGCTITKNGGIETDAFGRTNIEGVYASGDCTLSTPPQLINAASEGSKVASGVISDLINEEF